MEEDGIVERYAIGGAVGASFYLQPMSTLDVDVFVSLAPAQGQIVVSMSRIFEYWSKKDATIEGGHIVIAGWPVQFLSLGSPLGEEAMAEAVERDVGGTRIRVFTAEHLAAIALDTGRTKDQLRLLQFIEAELLKRDKFKVIITRHGLTKKWRDFQDKFLVS